MEDMIACMALSAPPPEFEVPPPATGCCGPIWIFEVGSLIFIWRTPFVCKAVWAMDTCIPMDMHSWRSGCSGSPYKYPLIPMVSLRIHPPLWISLRDEWMSLWTWHMTCTDIAHHIDIHRHIRISATGWPRLTGSLIFMGHCPQKWPVCSGSFVENDLQLEDPMSLGHHVCDVWTSNYVSLLQKIVSFIGFFCKRDL